MREIKFRGFHKCEDGQEKIVLDGKEIKGKWLQGYLMTDFLGDSAYICPKTTSMQYDMEHDCFDMGGFYKVIPETLKILEVKVDE